MNSDFDPRALLTRRRFIELLGVGYGSSLLAGCSAAMLQPNEGLTDTRKLVKFPEKSELWLLTDRPPQLETPLHYFRQDFTPNEAFFVRWHLEGIPSKIDAPTFRLNVGGHVQTPLAISLDQLRNDFEPFSIAAVNQCSGNSRSLFGPRVPGGQWKNGAMGNALWTGVRLKDILKKAGIKAGAVNVTFNGLDVPPLPSMADFVKSLDVEHASDGEVMVAYSMNGAELPLLNGYPLRLVVPGWYATYWVKMLSDISVLPAKYDGFWMRKAYLVPNNPGGLETPENLLTDTVPISRFTVRSIFVLPEPGQVVKSGATCEMNGLAMDDGHGIKQVELSFDGGNTWVQTSLDPSLGKFSWRRWRYKWQPPGPGDYEIHLKATTTDGVTQPREQWNRGGFMRNPIEVLPVKVV